MSVVIHEKSEYRLNSANAILAGLDELLDGAELWGKENDLLLIRPDGIHNYSDVPKLYKEIDRTSLFLIRTNDETGEVLQNISDEDQKKYFKILIQLKYCVEFRLQKDLLKQS